MRREPHGRAPAEGRRVFSTEFKRTAVQRILTGEKTLAELSRESQLLEAHAKIRELERAPGRKTMEVEILRAKNELTST